MKRTFILVLLSVIAVSAFSQTKRIAHRSHSGKDHTLILSTEDNFGGPATPPKKDTVVVKKTEPVKVKKVIHKKKRKKITHVTR